MNHIKQFTNPISGTTLSFSFQNRYVAVKDLKKMIANKKKFYWILVQIFNSDNYVYEDYENITINNDDDIFFILNGGFDVDNQYDRHLLHLYCTDNFDSIDYHKYMPKLSYTLKNNHVAMKYFIKIEYRIFQYVSNELKDDKHFVLFVATLTDDVGSGDPYTANRKVPNPDAFNIAMQYASNRLHQNYYIILKALKINHELFEYIDPRLFNSPKFMIEALKINNDFFEYIDRELFNNSQFMIEALKINNELFEYIDHELFNNSEFMREAIKHIPNVLLNDFNFAMHLVKYNGLLLCYLPEHFRENKNIVSVAVTQNKDALRYVSNRLQIKKSHNKIPK